MTVFLDVNHFLYYPRISDTIHRTYYYDKIKDFYYPNRRWVQDNCKEEVLFHYDDFLDNSIDTHTFRLIFRFDYEYDFVNYLIHWKLNE